MPTHLTEKNGFELIFSPLVIMVLNPYCWMDIDDTWLTSTVKERHTTADMLELACSTERATDRQERWGRGAAREARDDFVIFSVCFGTSCIALVHVSAEYVFSKSEPDVKCFGTPTSTWQGQVSELSGWGQRCKGDNLSGLTPLLHASLLMGRCSWGRGNRVGFEAWPWSFNRPTSDFCVDSLGLVPLHRGCRAWKSHCLSDKSSKGTVDCLIAMGNAFIPPTLFLPSLLLYSLTFILFVSLPFSPCFCLFPPSLSLPSSPSLSLCPVSRWLLACTWLVWVYIAGETDALTGSVSWCPLATLSQ